MIEIFVFTHTQYLCGYVSVWYRSGLRFLMWSKFDMNVYKFSCSFSVSSKWVEIDSEVMRKYCGIVDNDFVMSSR